MGYMNPLCKPIKDWWAGGGAFGGLKGGEQLRAAMVGVKQKG